jgi:hypothetical protein
MLQTKNSGVNESVERKKSEENIGQLMVKTDKASAA